MSAFFQYFGLGHPDRFAQLILFSYICLQDRTISDYWFETGTPNYLIELIDNNRIDIKELNDKDEDIDNIRSVQFGSDMDLYPVMYQSGYLTIKGFDKTFNYVTLGYPNREVERGFLNQLMKNYLKKVANRSSFNIRNFCLDVMNGRTEDFMTRLQSFFADITNEGFNRIGLEQHYQNVTYVLFTLMGFFTQMEYHTSSGRIDAVVKTQNYIYVFEFKLNGTAEEALAQIDDRNYPLPFKADGRKLIKVGANFSSKTHTIEQLIVSED